MSPCSLTLATFSLCVRVCVNKRTQLFEIEEELDVVFRGLDATRRSVRLRRRLVLRRKHSAHQLLCGGLQLLHSLTRNARGEEQRLSPAAASPASARAPASSR